MLHTLQQLLRKLGLNFGPGVQPDADTESREGAAGATERKAIQRRLATLRYTPSLLRVGSSRDDREVGVPSLGRLYPNFLHYYHVYHVSI